MMVVSISLPLIFEPFFGYIDVVITMRYLVRVKSKILKNLERIEKSLKGSKKKVCILLLTSEY